MFTIEYNYYSLALINSIFLYIRKKHSTAEQKSLARTTLIPKENAVFNSIMIVFIFDGILSFNINFFTFYKILGFRKTFFFKEEFFRKYYFY